MRLLAPALLALAAIVAFAAVPKERPANDRHAHLVLLLPAAAEPPAHYEKRLQSLALRAEAFFAKWNKHWNYPLERTRIFARDSKGQIRVTVVKADLANTDGRAALPNARAAAIRGATRALGLKDDTRATWWILYDYPGIKGFQGGARGFGGVAINAYPPGEDEIPLEGHLASPELAEMSIKGTIHEFGHALGLPHIGPKPNLDLGNTLMGPVNKAYWRKSGTNDQRVYLSEASAAAIWKHPIFLAEAQVDPPRPKKVRVSDLKAEETDDGSAILITGKLEADKKVHSAVALDTQRGRFGDYWSRTYLAGVDPATGNFSLKVDAPFQQGVIHLSFFFTNGNNTADGDLSFQRGSPIQVLYRTANGQRECAVRNPES